jgi:excisionase family DNA binding protein
VGEELFFEKLMTVEELAGALGFAPQTIRNWVAQRQMPYLRIGGKTRFRWKSIESWLERKEFQSWQ